MNYIYLIATLAILQFLVFGFLVGKARGKYGIKAPATTGNEHFERAFRAQMNTLEQLIAFLPALFMCAQFWPPMYVALLGLVYLIGRAIYWQAYLVEPKSRSLGFLLSFAPTVIMLFGILVGLARGAF